MIVRRKIEVLGRPEVEPAGEYVDGRPLIKCCSHVRCKTLYYSGVERPGLLHESNALMYWCNHTQEGIGFDNGDVSPHDCQPSRKCFEA